VEEATPLTAGESTSFKEIIRTANRAITPPDQNVLEDILHSKKTGNK